MNCVSKLVAGLVVTVVAVGFVTVASPSQSKKFPFAAEEDADGARFVWFTFGQAGCPYMYLPTKLLPTSDHFGLVSDGQPQSGDVAWWRAFVAVYAGENAPEGSNLLTARGAVGLKILRQKYGPLKWYRYLKSEPPSEPPQEKLIPLDKTLAALGSVLGCFPPVIVSETELGRAKADWGGAEKEFLTTLSAYPNSEEIERRLGDLYRLGHNITIPESWKKSEVHYRRALELSPWSVSSYLGLGMLYVNTDLSYAAKAEPLFTEAIKVSYGKGFPVDALSGLFYSYYYQGRIPEAIKAADKYISLRPKDESMKKLREIARSIRNKRRK